MKRTIFLSMVMVLSILSFVYPNSPADIKITINAQTVDIKVLHPVSDPSAHYIKRILIKVNSAQVFNDEFTVQSGNYQNLTREILALKKGDILAVTAYCSRYGDLTMEAAVK